MQTSNRNVYSYENKQNNSTKKFIIARSIGIIFGFLILIYSMVGGLDTQGSLTWALVGVLSAFFFDRVGEIWQISSTDLSRKQEINEYIVDAEKRSGAVSKEFIDLKSFISKTFGVEWIETKERITDIIDKLTDDAIKVRNTYVNIESDGGSDEKTIEIYNKFLSREGTYWYDIVSLAELYSGRYESISPKTTRKRMHEIVVLRHSLPMVNFAIFDFAGTRRKEVLFGWGQGRHFGTEVVFRSQDEKLIAMFENLYSVMWSSKRLTHIVVDYAESDLGKRLSSHATSKPIDKEGYWYTHAYDEQTGERIRTALFRIYFVGGQPVIEGIVANADASSSMERIDHRDPAKVTHSVDKIYIEYYRNEGSIISEGFVLYKFGRMLNIDTITGFFIDGKTQVRAKIVGCRVLDKTISGSIDNEMEKLRAAKTAHEDTLTSLWSRERGHNAKSENDIGLVQKKNNKEELPVP